ncbi:MAG: hypothetical protein CMD25_01810 [Flavobacteriales bacterium]|nr:hypothetical protein [Flavobacteriales bacterium]|tara:strand:- start:4131 stop:5762 length:1632 start_codon:yes stop_codon:yes gene_type:complete
MNKSLSIVFVLIFPFLNAQDIPNMEIQVKEGYKPSIQESVKLNTNAIYVDTLKKDRSQDYNPNNFKYNFLYNTRKLSPAKVKSDKIYQIYDNSLSFSAGYKSGPNFSYLHNSNRSKNKSYFLMIHHNSINSNIKTGNVNNKFCQSQSKINAGYKKVLSKQILYANLQYSRNISSSYGNYIPIRFETLQSRFNFAQFMLSLETIDSKNYSQKSTLFISDLNENSENIVGFNSLIDMDLFNLPISLDISLENFSNFNSPQSIDSIKSKNILLAGFAPSIKFKKYKMDLDLGFGIDYQSGEGFDVFPSLISTYHPVKNIIKIKFGIEDNKYRNTYYNLYQKNPFIYTLGTNQKIIEEDSELELRTTELKEMFFEFSNVLSSNDIIDLEFRYGVVSNLPFFDNNLTSYNRFKVFYKDDVWQTHLTLSYNRNINKILNIELSSDYYKWNDNEISHMPNLFLSIFPSVNLRDKIILSPSIKFIGPQKAYLKEIKSLPSRTYVDAKLDYKYNNKLNATIEFNNILNIKKEIWRDYKDIGFSALIMLTWSF